MSSPHVDYERTAGDYALRRRATDARLSVWAEAIAPFVENVRVGVDLGAGTGAFSAALHAWGVHRVVAIEPSAAMQAEAGHDTDVANVRGRAEALPLRDGIVDFVWISTAFHHFTEPHVAVDECRRVLTADGRVAIRGYVPGHSDLAWLELFPGADRARARFPDLATLTSWFATAGLPLVHAQLVEEGTQTYDERADFSHRMRHADSILTALSDQEVDAGVASLRARAETIEHFTLSLLVFGST